MYDMKTYVLLPTIIVLCTIFITSIIVVFQSTYVEITAIKLANEPEKYFVVINAEPALLRAISDPGKHVRLCSLNGIQIDDLIVQHGTTNIKCENDYYEIRIAVS